MAQWRQVEYAANNNMSSEARSIVLELLDSGNIKPSGTARRLPPGAAGGVMSDQIGSVYINTDFDGQLVDGVSYTGSVFDAPPIQLAETLMHEAKHVVDLAGMTEAERTAVYVEGSPENEQFEARAEEYARDNGCNEAIGWKCQ